MTEIISLNYEDYKEKLILKMSQIWLEYYY